MAGLGVGLTGRSAAHAGKVWELPRIWCRVHLAEDGSYTYATGRAARMTGGRAELLGGVGSIEVMGHISCAALCT